MPSPAHQGAHGRSPPRCQGSPAVPPWVQRAASYSHQNSTWEGSWRASQIVPGSSGRGGSRSQRRAARHRSAHTPGSSQLLLLGIPPLPQREQICECLRARKSLREDVLGKQRCLFSGEAACVLLGGGKAEGGELPPPDLGATGGSARIPAGRQITRRASRDWLASQKS